MSRFNQAPVQPVFKPCLNHRIRFEPVAHIYSVFNCGEWQQVKHSVSGLVAACFERFDPQKVIEENFNRWRYNPASKYFHVISRIMESGASEETAKLSIAQSWVEKGDEAARTGTDRHAVYEAHVLGLDTCPQLENWIASFEDEHNIALKPATAELAVFYEPGATVCQAAGCIDALFVDQFGEYWCVDWKTSKGVCPDAVSYRNGIGFASDIGDSKFNRYSLQLALYARLLKSCTNIDVGNRRIIGVAESEFSDMRTLFAETSTSDRIASDILDSLVV